MCGKKDKLFRERLSANGKNREKPRRRYDSWRMFASSAVIVRADLSRRRPLSSRPVSGDISAGRKYRFIILTPRTPPPHTSPSSSLPARLSVIKAIHFDDDVPRILREYFFFFCFFNANLRTIDSAPPPVNPPSPRRRRWVSDRNHGTGDPE